MFLDLLVEDDTCLWRFPNLQILHPPDKTNNNPITVILEATFKLFISDAFYMDNLPEIPDSENVKGHFRTAAFIAAQFVFEAGVDRLRLKAFKIAYV